MFGEKYHQDNAKNTSALSKLPRLSEKSGYGPDTMMLFNEKERCQCRTAYIVL